MGIDESFDDETDLEFYEREYGDFDDGDYCTRCDDAGVILVCPDDMCRGLGECVHGDGEVICPNCRGGNAY